MVNSTIVTEFLLMGFVDEWELRILHAMLFLLMYLFTLLGNVLIIAATTLDRNLHTPMYFFLRNLSLLDMFYISVTVPNACVSFLTNNWAISMVGCAIQIFLVVYCAYVELLLLTIMACDRYTAICQPLHYPVIMNQRFCVQMTLASILSGFIYAGVHTGNTFRLPFCQSNVVHQFFCDIPSLLRLSCSDILSNLLLIFVSIIVIGGACFIFIAVSYIRVFSTVLKYPTKDHRKVFSTCVPHLLVVSAFLGSVGSVYLRPSVSSDTIHDMIPSVFYAIAPPLLNPMIYSLRNKQIKEAVRKIMRRKVYSNSI